MNKAAKLTLFFLRVGLGVVFFYAGITKILDPEWSAAGYISNSNVLPELYTWLSAAGNIEWVNFLNKWGLLLIGVSLILGLFVRISSPLGALMMLLYYFPTVDFPMAGDHSYIVDDHIIYVLILIFFAVVGAGRYYGIDGFIHKRKG